MTDQRICLPQVHACALRVTALDNNGVPLPGAGNLYVSNAMSRLTIKPVYKDGDEIEEPNACGDLIVQYKEDDYFKRADFELELLTPDPYLHELLVTGSDALVESGSQVGWAFPPIGLVQGNGVGLEVWAKRINDGVLDTLYPYNWWTMPLAKNIRIGDAEFSKNAYKPVLSGQLYENANWFDGPENDWPAASDRVAQWIPTASKPAATCGATTLSPS